MLGRFGIWSRELRFGDAAESVESAAELEQLGFGTLWIPGGAGGDILDTVETMLEATAAAVVATGILNVWMHDAAAVAETHAALDEAHPGRFLLGLGISHAPLDRLGRDRPSLCEAARDDDCIPRCARCACARGHAAATGAGGPGTENGRAGRAPDARRPSVHGPGRAHTLGARCAG